METTVETNAAEAGQQSQTPTGPSDKDLNNLSQIMFGRSMPGYKPEETPEADKTSSPVETSKPAEGTPSPAGKDVTPKDTPAGANPLMVDLSTLGFKSKEDFDKEWGNLPQMKKELQQLSEYKNGPRFKSERAKFIHDWASQYEGMEAGRARQLLDLADLDLQKDPDHVLRFAAFRLRPEYANVAENKLQKLFANEERRFGDPTDEANPRTDVQEIEAEIATDNARKVIQKVLDEFNAARPAEMTPEQEAKEIEEYNQFLKKQLSDFKGLPTIELSAETSGKEKLTGALNFEVDPKDLPGIVESVRDLQGFWESLLVDEGIMQKGQQGFDHKKMASLITQIKNRTVLMNKAYQQGLSDGEAHTIKIKRNIQDPSNPVAPADAGNQGNGTGVTKETAETLRRIGIIR